MPSSLKDCFNLTGKVAIVTGASKGIGAAIARGLAEFGASVVVSSRKQEAVEEVAAELVRDGFHACGVAAHVGEPGQVQALVDAAVSRFSGLDIVVNNAAINPVFGPAIQTESAVFDKIMAVNLKGPFELARRAYPHLCRHGGAVINISSVGGLRPEPLLGIYSVSKAALISLTQVLAQEWGSDNIRVNAICPGLVQTKFSAAMWQNEEVLQQFLSRVPLGRIAQPEEIVPLAVFLASEAASYCTGGVYTVDGGHTV